mmetsp:Transcript_81561/g.144020  ORF Transcript_81561/g.144020 Transcript_81561/m.144020 type:complete len:193 (-) Transcript_81561:157-735(-)
MVRGLFFLICSISLAAKINTHPQPTDTDGVHQPGDVHPIHTPGSHPVDHPDGPPRGHGFQASSLGVSFPCIAGGVLGSLFGAVPGVAIGLWTPDGQPVLGGMLGAALTGATGAFLGHEVTIDHIDHHGQRDPLGEDLFDPLALQEEHGDHEGHTEHHHYEALTAVALSDHAGELATGSHKKLAEASSQAAGS